VVVVSVEEEPRGNGQRSIDDCESKKVLMLLAYVDSRILKGEAVYKKP
jgi:hypothetical protein